MKRLLCFSIIILLICSCGKQNGDSDVDNSIVENSAEIKFEREAIDFHDLNNGEIITGSFKFKNVGKYKLVISEVTTSCGCTVADYPKNPIKPGEEGMISVTYDSKGYSGKRIVKEVFVIANTDPSLTKLLIYANVY